MLSHPVSLFSYPHPLSPTTETPLQLSHAKFDHRRPTIGGAVRQVAAEQLVEQTPCLVE
jgi:hypothetical protein